jgi:hypothetical protein
MQTHEDSALLRRIAQAPLAPGGSLHSAPAPVTLGSEGGPSSAGSGGAGGGVVRLTMGGTLALQGRISADALNALGGNADGGAGGSIYLTVGSLTGNGPLWALGSGGNGAGGGGGGGRVSILGDICRSSPSRNTKNKTSNL